MTEKNRTAAKAESGAPARETLERPLVLPCGATLKNRIAKAAMSDSLGNGSGDPTPEQIRLYERWADGGSALSIIGEVQVDPRYPEKPGNLAFGDWSDAASVRALATAGARNDALLWPQLGHAGALAHAPVSRPAGPSALALDGLRCDAMTAPQIEALPAAYAAAARFSQRSGFGGVHIHAGHGFLLSQFLSPLFNKRTDAYGGSLQGRSRLLFEIVEAIRGAVGDAFPIGVKTNSSDMLEGGLTNDEALDLLRRLDGTSLDLIDISGGTYFPGAKASSDGASRGGPYFLEFAKRARPLVRIPLMLTGGFTRRDQAVDALESGAVDVIGIGRGLIIDPDLPSRWLSDAGGDPVFPRFDAPPPGGITAWHTMRLTAIGEDREADFDPPLADAIRAYEARDAERSTKWKSRFDQDL